METILSNPECECEPSVDNLVNHCLPTSEPTTAQARRNVMECALWISEFERLMFETPTAEIVGDEMWEKGGAR